jgi:hypothetical protein
MCRLLPFHVTIILLYLDVSFCDLVAFVDDYHVDYHYHYHDFVVV